jgi:hypothetical protein
VDYADGHEERTMTLAELLLAIRQLPALEQLETHLWKAWAEL